MDIAYLGRATNIAAFKSYSVHSLPFVSKAHLAEVFFKSSRYSGLIAKAISSSDAVLGSATDETFIELHYLVREDFLHSILSGEATTQDLKAACDWLKTNDITGVAYDGSPLDKLNKLLPTVDPSLVKRKVYGKNF